MLLWLVAATGARWKLAQRVFDVSRALLSGWLLAGAQVSDTETTENAKREIL